MAKSAVHWRSIRLMVNAGMEFPACHANAELLDMKKAYLDVTTVKERVTCTRCKKMLDEHQKAQA